MKSVNTHDEYEINVYVPYADRIVSIEDVTDEWMANEKEDEYVYDLETGNHHFHAGHGDLIVHNTDSIFTLFRDAKNVETAIQLGQECSKAITEHIGRSPIFLEYEKVYYPLLLWKKKHYCGRMFEFSPDPNKSTMDKKGITIKRRDYCSLVKEVGTTILDKLMKYQDVDGACTYIKQQVHDLLNDRVPVEKLTITKSLRHEYKMDNIPHKMVAERVNQRAGVEVIRSGDRVPYVFIENKNKKAKQFEKVEDPIYAAEKGLKIDSMYYLEHQLQNTILLFMKFFMEDPTRLYQEDVHIKTRLKNHLQDIRTFFSKKSV